MQDETKQVLEMLAAGTITADQAAELLDALDEKPAPQPAGQAQRSGNPHPNRGHRGHGHRHARRDSPLNRLIEARMLGVNAEFVQEMREAGYGNLSLEELTELKAVGVNAEFVKEMTHLGFTGLSADELQELRVSGINAEFIREMGRLGYLDALRGIVPEAEDEAEGEAEATPSEEELR